MFGFKKQDEVIKNFNTALERASYFQIIDTKEGYFIGKRRTDCFDVNATEPCLVAISIKDFKEAFFNYDYLVNEFNKQNLMLHALVEMIKYE